MRPSKWAAALLVLGLAVVLLIGPALAKGNGQRRNGQGFGRGGQGPGRAACQVPAVNHPAFGQACGECHLAYQPALLPAASWKKILAGLNDHFGEKVELAPADAASIARYLAANAADFCPAAPSRRIMRCLGGNSPLRITEVPYIARRHAALPTDAPRRPAVGSLANCNACHRTAASGLYDREFARIPD